MTERFTFNGNVSPITCHAWNKDRSREYFMIFFLICAIFSLHIWISKSGILIKRHAR